MFIYPFKRVTNTEQSYMVSLYVKPCILTINEPTYL